MPEKDRKCLKSFNYLESEGFISCNESISRGRLFFPFPRRIARHKAQGLDAGRDFKIEQEPFRSKTEANSMSWICEVP